MHQEGLGTNAWDDVVMNVHMFILGLSLTSVVLSVLIPLSLVLVQPGSCATALLILPKEPIHSPNVGVRSLPCAAAGSFLMCGGCDPSHLCCGCDHTSSSMESQSPHRSCLHTELFVVLTGISHSLFSMFLMLWDSKA